MASKKISDLTPQTDIISTDLLEIETAGGLSRKTTAGTLFTRIGDLEADVAALATLTAGKSASYVITDIDLINRAEVDTTSGDITITLPLKANNLGRQITIANVKGGINKVIISPNATDANKLTDDGLNVIWLPKIGDFITFKESATSGFWDVVAERVTCSIEIDTHAGYGSTDNKIPRFTNIPRSLGNMVSENHSTGYASNADGLEITINRSGKYSFTYNGVVVSGSAGYFGISVNSNQLTTSIASITLLHRKSVIFAGSTTAGPTTYTAYFSKGDVVRPHTDGTTPATVAFCKFFVEYLG